MLETAAWKPDSERPTPSYSKPWRYDVPSNRGRDRRSFARAAPPAVLVELPDLRAHPARARNLCALSRRLRALQERAHAALCLRPVLLKSPIRPNHGRRRARLPGASRRTGRRSGRVWTSTLAVRLAPTLEVGSRLGIKDAYSISRLRPPTGGRNTSRHPRLQLWSSSGCFLRDRRGFAGPAAFRISRRQSRRCIRATTFRRS